MSASSINARSKAKEKRTNIFWAYCAALIAMPPLNEHVTGPLAGRILDAPGSFASLILAGVMSGAVLGGVLWIIGRRTTKSLRKKAAQ